ncbi:MAG: hypothetical protein M1820_008058 [Bogoriella megaspora]|nr:MAG: hypothetical protein M1820_008058 [Bogoriella megaspora]
MTKQPIEVFSDAPLHPACRVNFSKTYTVEHNLKVKDAGKVAPEKLHLLTGYWRDTLVDRESIPTSNSSHTTRELAGPPSARRLLSAQLGSVGQSQVSQQDGSPSESRYTAGKALPGTADRVVSSLTGNAKQPQESRQDQTSFDSIHNDCGFTPETTERDTLALEAELEQLQHTLRDQPSSITVHDASGSTSRTGDPGITQVQQERAANLPPETPGLSSSAETNVSNRSTSPTATQRTSYARERDIRFLAPHNWLQSLESMEAEVMKTSLSMCDYSVNSNHCSISYDEDLYQHFENWPSSLSSSSSSLSSSPASVSQQWKQELEKSDRILESSLRAMDILTKSGYTSERTTLVCVDNRRSNVARLVTIERRQIEDLRHALGEDLQTTLFDIHIGRIDLCVTAPVISQLSDQLFKHVVLPETLPQLCLWARLIARTIDLGIVSFCSAHLGAFDEEGFGCSIESFYVGKTETEADLYTSSAPVLVFRRRPFQCLHEFFDKQGVWTFEMLELDVTERFQGPGGARPTLPALSLSTGVEEFNGTWGPIWAVCSTAEEYCQKLIHFNLEVGFVVAWEREVNAPALFDSETFCHWTTDRMDLRDRADFPFPECSLQDLKQCRLLIGARSLLERNEVCGPSLTQFVSGMKLKHRVELLGISDQGSYCDAQTITVGFNVHGVMANYGRTYKRRDGGSFKRSLVARWENEPQKVDPRILQVQCGLELSTCSRNAYRRKLAHLLGSGMIQNWLKNVFFPWKDKASSDRYYESLNSEDCNAFFRLYEESNEDQREDFLKAMKYSLSVLKETGLDENQNLWAFCSLEAGIKIQFPFQEYDWTGICKDTSTSCTMAVVTDACLEFYHPTHANLSALCMHKGQSSHTILETSIRINTEADAVKGLIKIDRPSRDQCQYKSHWSARGVERDEIFDLGRSGRLCVLRAERGVLMARWTEPSPALKVMNFANKFRTKHSLPKQNPHHWEVTVEDSVEPGFDEAPLPLLLTSDAAYVLSM